MPRKFWEGGPGAESLLPGWGWALPCLLQPALPGVQAPTLSLYLLEADFRVPAAPDGPRPCFRSCMVTSWLAARDNSSALEYRGATQPPPRGLLEAPPTPRSPEATVLSIGGGPSPQFSERAEALTRLFDRDGEAVVVGAALGLHGHLVGGVP